MASNRKKIARLRTRLRKFKSTVKECSRAKVQEGENTVVAQPAEYVIETGEIAALKVYDFDAAKTAWYPHVGNEHVPKSVDALYLDKDGTLFAVEFKSGDVDTADLVRKIHETVMGCIENLGLHDSELSHYAFYRRKMIFLVVASTLKQLNAKEKTFYRTFCAFPRPWEHAKYPIRWDIKPLEDVLVKKVHTLSPKMFEQLAQEYRWIPCK